MIEVKNVVKKYPNGIVALKGIQTKINQGEFVYIVGPSGAGKSTFIKMLYCEEQPSKGELRINGVNLSRIKKGDIPKLRRQMGVVFQDFKLLPKKNVYENVAFALEVIEKPIPEIKMRVMQVLQTVGLHHKAKMFPDELSGGEQQRVAIARSIVNSPKFVIADEPTGNLDPETAWDIMNVFQEIHRQGTTIIMATHNRDIVNKLRQRVIMIKNGRIVRDEFGGRYDYE